MRRMWSTTSAPRFVATPLTNVSFFHLRPSIASVIEPPDTLEIPFSFGSSPISFSRVSEPKANTMARSPPPDKQSAIPGEGFSRGSSLGIRVTGDVESIRARVLSLMGKVAGGVGCDWTPAIPPYPNTGAGPLSRFNSSQPAAWRSLRGVSLCIGQPA